MTASLPKASEIIVATGRQQILRIAGAMAALNLLIPTSLFVYAEMTGKAHWRLYRGEDNIVEWFSSIQLLLLGLVAYLNHRLAVVTRRLELRGPTRHRWIWPAFALGFVFLALDERFGAHEALRDNVFRPAGLFVGLPYVSAGDVGLYLFFLVGLMVTPFLLGELRRQPPSLTLFLVALILTLATVVIDSLTDATLRAWPFPRFWDYIFEEVAEIWAQLLFLLSFLVVLYGRLGEMVTGEHRGGSL